MRDNFTQSFISKELREHQKNVLIEMQMALMPETQLVVEALNHRDRINRQIAELQKTRQEKQMMNRAHEEMMMGEYIHKKAALANMSSYNTNYYGNLFIAQVKNAIQPYSREDTTIPDDGLRGTMNAIIENYNKLSEQLKENAITIELNKRPEWQEHIEQRNLEMHDLNVQISRLVEKRDKEPAKQRAEFIKKCGDPDCRGFLSTRWKCGLCEKQTCKDCHEVIKCDENDPPHVCDPNVVETIKLLKTDTKNCPGCQTSITKIDGCDQMWCTQCKTGFSWSTGKIELKLHNPHYYEWRRQNGGLDREPGDNQQCVTPADIFNSIQNSVVIENNLKMELTEKCRQCIHNSAYNTNPQIPDFEMYRIQYLRNFIDVEEFKSTLIRLNKAYSKKHELYTVYQLLETTFTDIMRRFCMNFQDTSVLSELNTIIEYVNGCFADIAYSYGSTTKHVVGRNMSVSKVSMRRANDIETERD
ncbi:MAG: hypothetical protein ACOVRN_19240 [Flavobacterium sp.]